MMPDSCDFFNGYHSDLRFQMLKKSNGTIQLPWAVQTCPIVDFLLSIERRKLNTDITSSIKTIFINS